MRVLHITSNLDPIAGGPARALDGLARAQVSAGLQCRVLSTWQGQRDDELIDSLRNAGIGVTLVGPCVGALKRHPQLGETVRREVAEADILHIHALWEEVQYLAAVAAFRSRVPYVIRPCGMLEPWSLSQGWLKKRLYIFWRLRRVIDRAAAVHYTTERERELALPLRFQTRGFVVPNGIDLREFHELPASGSFRARHERIGNKRMVLCLSRIHPKKGFDLLIAAFAQAALENTVLVIAGHDDVGYMGSIDALVRTHDVEDRIVFTGRLGSAERVEALVDADVLALTSHQENFGVAVVESLAAGTPVIISDQVAIAAEMEKTGAARVVPLSVEIIAAELRRWSQDQDSLKRAASEARPLICSRYDWNRIAQRWRDEYESLAGSTRSPR